MRKLLTALLLLIGTLGVVDIASARTPEELNKQCQKGNAPACVLLGIMYDNGEGVKQDSFKAAELYRQACDGKDATKMGAPSTSKPMRSATPRETSGTQLIRPPVRPQRRGLRHTAGVQNKGLR